MPGPWCGSKGPSVHHPRQHMPCSEYAMVVASRLYFSAFYRTVYLIMIASSVACVAWTVANHWRTPTSDVFISLEILLCCMLVVEVVIRMLALKRKFWTRWTNLFDVTATVLSIVSIALYFQQQGVVEELEEIAADFMMMLRNANQYMRLAVFLKNRKMLTSQKSADSNGIDFDDLDEEEQATMLMQPAQDDDECHDEVVVDVGAPSSVVEPMDATGSYDEVKLTA
ncbi:hypothetical protein, variant [Aphanomyces invadans]|uniref:Ion transport domain-containing protein n=1 Tax=Aphanomyces invadans TaxID=157072 RepID=A0A024UKX2_9STRA|nr:hypothetical protein H310_03032 [Aphanomyces invadans]XP_008864994.1 hypothetical protein, variant [Aphanomyces invadans]ETW06918.1 hypothetical protein H310_03032 [Aphanomyces invadans]ETW06919.1 hypothetical protein, variant [Aphanomyces invadans]|eukprot:XP_008864993.1 hypothetical protein H310_03032 [Aphanomyces invadans]